MESAAPLSPRMKVLMDASIAVVGAHGTRGLTHRAVDREVGLPEGSCSAYLRTRQALLVALTRYVAAQLSADVSELGEELAGCPGDDPRAVEATTRLILKWLDSPGLVVTRLELATEASRNPELADLFADWRRDLVTLVDDIVAASGKEHSASRAETLVAAYDGTLLGALLKPPTERPDYVRDRISMLMGSLATPQTVLES
ncbi:TetR/AcrR family transcriptional regulator [Nocardioides speluncae]|uniref:TetR/AcrR family transcriptional regulator n=1 Tax=Nocardioides speluncae TaxID=2670337 RepID=UPI0012B174F6|nr:TetR family transcriptional regulator C-terminal domain-containing protein [Nocardioides speluncae]